MHIDDDLFVVEAGRYLDARASASGKRVQFHVGNEMHQNNPELCYFLFREDKLVERAKSLKVNVGTEQDADLGPVISKQAKEHVCRLIQNGIDSGARLALDGRNIVASVCIFLVLSFLFLMIADLHM
ncbi:hypothetical protein LOK49_LG06G01955 [Camellia lanceoleosa]|uniref:Uncharacterized protein n=1 Tax=Camellia lanceoleosa TaxID=1840588 RepID=A0ACC0HGA9_9ERIC|nr:hypothetical protein LOK49_LG06G01955 [Camellia lanceoleosa]